MLKVADWKGPVTIAGERQPKWSEIAPGEYSIDLRKGEQVVVQPRGNQAVPVVRPLDLADGQKNLYGVKRGKQLKSSQDWPEVPIPAAQ